MCFGAREKGDEAGAARSRELDKIIRADEKKMSKEVKLLLLGTDASARSIALSAAILTVSNRSGRIRQIHGAQADEVDLRAGVQQKRKAGVEASSIPEYRPFLSINLRRHERAQHPI